MWKHPTQVDTSEFYVFCSVLLWKLEISTYAEVCICVDRLPVSGRPNAGSRKTRNMVRIQLPHTSQTKEC